MFFVVPLVAFFLAYRITNKISNKVINEFKVPEKGLIDFFASLSIVPLWFIFFGIGEVLVFVLICMVEYI